MRTKRDRMRGVAVLPVGMADEPLMAELSDVKSLRLVNRLVEEINTGYTLEQVLDLLYQQIREIIPCDRIGVAVVNEKEDRLTLVGCRSDGAVYLPVGYTGSLMGSSLEGLLKTRETRIINDLEDYLRKKPTSEATRLMVKEGMRSSLTLPLLIQSKSIGVIFFSSRGQNTYNPGHENFLKLVAGHIAITLEKARLMDEVKRGQEYLDNILRNSADAIIVIDRENNIRTWNEGAREIFGYEPQEMIGKSVDVIVPPEKREELKHLQEQIEHQGFIKNFETVRVTKDRRRLTVSITSTVIKDKRGRILGRSSIVRDITTLKKLQEELIHRENLAALGELAATIAHEVKNPLAGISGAIQVLSQGLPERDSRREVMKEILQQVSRLDETVRDLLLFAKPWKPSPTPVDLDSVIERVLSSVRAGHSLDNITLVKECQGHCIAEVDPQQMEHLFANLIHNAFQAMPKGGTLSIRCISGPCNVHVEIADTGVGISPEHQARLFKPFFSTKVRGTGLGLSISKKIVDAHRGEIVLESTVGKGTKVKITLPKASGRKGL